MVLSAYRPGSPRLDSPGLRALHCVLMPPPATTAVAPVSNRWAEHESLLVRETLKRLGRSLDPADSIREMLHLLSELLGLNRGRVLLFDSEAKALTIRYAYGLTRAEMRPVASLRARGVTGKVYRMASQRSFRTSTPNLRSCAGPSSASACPRRPSPTSPLPIESGGRIVACSACTACGAGIARYPTISKSSAVVATLIGQVLQIRRLSRSALPRSNRRTAS